MALFVVLFESLKFKVNIDVWILFATVWRLKVFNNLVEFLLISQEFIVRL